MEPITHIIYSLIIVALVWYIYYKIEKRVDIAVNKLNMKVVSAQASVNHLRGDIEELREEYGNIQLTTIMDMKSKATRGELQDLEVFCSGTKSGVNALLDRYESLESEVQRKLDTCSTVINNGGLLTDELLSRVTDLENAAVGYQVVDERLSKLEERNKPGAWVPVNWFK